MPPTKTQPARMCSTHESLQIIRRAVIRIDAIVVAHRVGTADRSLLLLLADRMDRHQPKYRDSQLFQFIEPRRDGIEGSLLRKRARIDFVIHTVAHPIAHRPRLLPEGT